MQTVTDIGSLIVRSDDVRGGRPRIAGTGVTVQRIVGWYKQGLTPEEIATEIPHLSLAQVYAALTYYHANRDAIEADIAAEDTTSTKIRCGRRWSLRSAPVASMCIPPSKPR